MSDQLDNTLTTVEEKPVANSAPVQNTLDALANRVEVATAQIQKHSDEIKETNTLTKLGFYIIIVMVATIIVSAIIFEIQVINDNSSRTTQLLQSINDKVSK